MHNEWTRMKEGMNESMEYDASREWSNAQRRGMDKKRNMNMNRATPCHRVVMHILGMKGMKGKECIMRVTVHDDPQCDAMSTHHHHQHPSSMKREYTAMTRIKHQGNEYTH